MPGSNFAGQNIEKPGDGSNDLIVAGNLFDNSIGNTMLNVFRTDEATGSESEKCHGCRCAYNNR
jgi:hypothetical protein